MKFLYYICYLIFTGPSLPTMSALPSVEDTLAFIVAMCQYFGSFQQTFNYYDLHGQADRDHIADTGKDAFYAQVFAKLLESGVTATDDGNGQSFTVTTSQTL